MGLKDLCLVVQSPDGSRLLVASYQSLTLEQILCNFFISELDEGTECILSTFADDAELVGAVDTREVREMSEKGPQHPGGMG